MAKQENTPRQPDSTMPVHPDPNKETIMLRYPQDGSVKVVSDLKMVQNKPTITTVEPSLKNQAAFFPKVNSRMIAAFFSSLRAQSQNPKELPELFVVTFNLVAQVADKLLRLQVDPKDEEGLKTSRQYRTSAQQLDRVIYDQARMPKDELRAAGFDVEQMTRDGAFKEMELGKDTSKLYSHVNKAAEHVSTDGVYSIHPSQNEAGEIHFSGRGPRAIPEFLEDERMNKELNKDEKDALRAGKTLDRVLQHEGEYCYVGFNRRTNLMIYVPCKDVKVPAFIYNARVNPAQQEELGRGGRVMLENCHYFNSDNNFKGVAQFDVNRMEFNIAEPYYSRAYVPDFIDKQLSKDLRAALIDRGETVDGRQLVGKDGNRYNSNLRINPYTLGLEFVKYQKPEESQTQDQAASQAQTREQTQTREQFGGQSAEGVQEQEPFMIPEATPQEGVSRGRGM